MALQPSPGALLASSQSSPGSMRPSPHLFGLGTGMVGMSGRASSLDGPPVPLPAPLPVPVPVPPPLPDPIMPLPPSGSRDRFSQPMAVTANKTGSTRSQDIPTLRQIEAQVIT